MLASGLAVIKLCNALEFFLPHLLGQIRTVVGATSATWMLLSPMPFIKKDHRYLLSQEWDTFQMLQLPKSRLQRDLKIYEIKLWIIYYRNCSHVKNLALTLIDPRQLKLYEVVLPRTGQLPWWHFTWREYPW